MLAAGCRDVKKYGSYLVAKLRNPNWSDVQMTERRRIGLREIRALLPGQIAWDGAVHGFGARCQGSAVAYILKFRTVEGRQRWHTIGRHGAPWTPDTARAEAVRLLGEIVTGADPAADKRALRAAITVKALCEQYLADAEAGKILVRGGRPKKPLTLVSDRGRIHGHIIPLIGQLAVRAVTKRDIEQMMHAIAEGKTACQTRTRPRGISRVTGGRGTATRTVGLAGAIFSYAIDQKFRDDNPAHRVRKFAEGKRKRRLAHEEYAFVRNGLHLSKVADIWPPAIDCLEFLLMTGWRSGEALSLRWNEVDLIRRTALLPDTKTGESMRSLSTAACEILCRLPRTNADGLVFSASRGNGIMSGFKKFVRKILASGGVPRDVTPNVFRHSFVSLGADLGLSEPTIGVLVGHKGHSVTGRYMHFADAALLAAADTIANEIQSLMGGAQPEPLDRFQASI